MSAFFSYTEIILCIREKMPENHPCNHRLRDFQLLYAASQPPHML